MTTKTALKKVPREDAKRIHDAVRYYIERCDWSAEVEADGPAELVEFERILNLMETR